MPLIKADGNISALPSSAISGRRRRSGRSGGGGWGSYWPNGVLGREGRGEVIEGEEMPWGRRWGSEELLKG